MKIFEHIYWGPTKVLFIKDLLIVNMALSLAHVHVLVHGIPASYLILGSYCLTLSPNGNVKDIVTFDIHSIH